MDNFPVFDGEKDKSVGREMLSAVDQNSNATKVLKTKTPEGFDKEVRLRTRSGSPEFVTTISPPDPDKEGPVGGFILRPSDGKEDQESVETEHKWDAAFLKTTEYEVPQKFEKVYLLKKLKRKQSNTRNKVKLHTKRKSAPVTWTGKKEYPSGRVGECIVSFDHGIKARYRLHRDQDCSGRIIKFTEEEPECAQSGKPNIYINGIEIETKYTAPGGDIDVTLNVVGAAVFKNKLIFISHRDLDFPLIEDATSRDGKIASGVAHSTTVSLFYFDGGDWVKFGVHHASSALKSPWSFKPDGSRASSVRETAATNQWLMHIDISEDDAGNLYSSFSESPISDSEPFYIETTLSATTTSSSGDTGWQSPGEWNAEEYGSLSIGYAIGPRSGTTVEGTAGLAYELKAYVDGTGIVGTPYRVEKYRVDSGQSSFVAATNNKSVGIFSTYEIYMLINAYNNVRGQVDFRAFRDTENISEDMETIDTFPRHVGGKRTIAVDYGFDGSFLAITEELKSIGTSFSTGAKSKRTTKYIRPSYGAETIHDILDQTTKFSASGSVEWQIKINGEILFSVSGGVNDSGDCESSYSRKQDSTKSSSSDVISGYQIPSGALHTERAWLIDMDARSKSCVYEKLRYDFVPDATVAATSSDFRVIFPNRLMTNGSSKASLHFINRGTQRYVEEIPIGSGTSPVMFRPYSLMMQLVPRFHDANELTEEEFILQYMAWSTGSADLDAYRFFYIESGSMFDGMPRGGIHGDKEGQLQCRNIDQAVFSSATRTTAQLQSPSLSSTPSTKLHDVTYTTRAYLRDEEYPLLAKVVEKLSDDSGASDYSNPRSSLRLNPIFST